MSERIKTGLIIVGIYLIFLLYLFFVSCRFEQLEKNSVEEQTSIAIKLSK